MQTVKHINGTGATSPLAVWRNHAEQYYDEEPIQHIPLIYMAASRHWQSPVWGLFQMEVWTKLAALIATLLKLRKELAYRVSVSIKRNKSGVGKSDESSQLSVILSSVYLINDLILCIMINKFSQLLNSYGTVRSQTLLSPLRKLVICVRAVARRIMRPSRSSAYAICLLWVGG